MCEERERELLPITHREVIAERWFNSLCRLGSIAQSWCITISLSRLRSCSSQPMRGRRVETEEIETGEREATEQTVGRGLAPVQGEPNGIEIEKGKLLFGT